MRPSWEDAGLRLSANRSKSAPSRWWQVALGTAAIAIAIARIASTYPVFNQTYDEPISVACGMQWLNQGTYRYDPKHPPLGRVAAALGGYVTGNRGSGDPDARAEGNRIFSRQGRYWRNITLARLGVLPFFVLASVGVGLWTAWAAGPLAGLLAAVLLTLLPPGLGHAGLAMTDGVLLGTFTFALFAWCLWLERPSARRSLLLGAAAGLAVLSKLFALVFLPVCGALIAVAYVLRREPGGSGDRWAFRLRAGGLALLVCALTIWAGYRFSFHRYAEGPVPARDAAHRALEVPIPAPEFLEGIVELWHHNQQSHYNVFLGQRSNTGWWYYYPVILAVKTPVAFWVLFGFGLLGLRRGHWRVWALLLPAAGILLGAQFSHINTGVRHILPIYGALAAMAGVGALYLMRASWRSRGLCGVLLLWLVLESSMAHPDYMAYFNELADGTSGWFGVDSDLDYGQDLARLGAACARRGIGSLSVAYYGTADTGQMGLPPHRILPPATPATGWVAISINKLKLGDEEDNPADYAWLEQFRPVALVGKSIWLYHIPEPGSALAWRNPVAQDRASR